IKVAVHVTAHSVEPKIRELNQQPLPGQAAVALDCKSPDIPLHGLVHVKSLAIGADLDTVRRTHVGGGARYLTVRVDAPNLTGRFSPVWIARPERAIVRDGHIIRLVRRR